jgi:hypothetical protein
MDQLVLVTNEAMEVASPMNIIYTLLYQLSVMGYMILMPVTNTQSM